MDFVADESGRLVNQMDPISKTVFEIDFVPGGYRHAIGDDDHWTASQSRMVTHGVQQPTKLEPASSMAAKFQKTVGY
jgi:hypothetical protein